MSNPCKRVAKLPVLATCLNHRCQLTAPVITKPQNLRLAVDPTVKRMFVRMFKSPVGHRRHFVDAVHQTEGGSVSPLSMDQIATWLKSCERPSAHVPDTHRILFVGKANCRMLGIAVPTSLLAVTDEVIE